MVDVHFTEHAIEALRKTQNRYVGEDMKVRYDPRGDVLYIEISSEKVVETVELDDDLLVDYDREGNIVGIEIWRAREVLLGEMFRRIKELGLDIKIAEVEG